MTFRPGQYWLLVTDSVAEILEIDDVWISYKVNSVTFSKRIEEFKVKREWIPEKGRFKRKKWSREFC